MTRGHCFRRAAPRSHSPTTAWPTVAVLGAVGPDKGARRLERLADLVRATGARVRFVLIGYMDVQHGPWQSDDAVLTVHGRYDPRELTQLFAHYRVRLVAYPSAGPGNIQLHAVRIVGGRLSRVSCRRSVPLPSASTGTGAGWAWTDEEWRDEAKMLARIAAAVAPENSDALAAASDCAAPGAAAHACGDGGTHARALRQGDRFRYGALDAPAAFRVGAGAQRGTTAMSAAGPPQGANCSPMGAAQRPNCPMRPRAWGSTG